MTGAAGAILMVLVGLFLVLRTVRGDRKLPDLILGAS